MPYGCWRHSCYLVGAVRLTGALVPGVQGAARLAYPRIDDADTFCHKASAIEPMPGLRGYYSAFTPRCPIAM